MPRPIDKGLAGPGLLAHVITNQIAYHLPLYRLEQTLAHLVTGRFKTSHLWALQNQPRLWVVSDTFVEFNRIGDLFKVSGFDRHTFSFVGRFSSFDDSASLQALRPPLDGLFTLLRGALRAGGRFGWF